MRGSRPGAIVGAVLMLAIAISTALTDEFRAGLEELMTLAQEDSCAIMCAEAVPWRCHRRLVADALLVRGYTVLEIISGGTPKEHELTTFAVVDGTRVTYPG